MSDHKSKICFKEKINQFFYEISFTNKMSGLIYSLTWLIEKAMLSVLPLLIIFKNTTWENNAQKLAYLSGLPLSWFTYTSFFVYCLIYQGFLFVLIILLIIRIAINRKFPIFFEQLVCYLLPFLFKGLAQIIFMEVFYLFRLFMKDLEFPSYKDLSNHPFQAYSAAHIGITITTGILFLCVLILNILDALLVQRQRMTIWCTESWKYRLLSLVIKLTISGVFVLDPFDEYIVYTGILISILILTKIILKFINPLSYDPFCELCELFHDTVLLLFYIISVTTQSSSIDNEINLHEYTIITPIYAVIICLVRASMKSKLIITERGSEQTALENLRILLKHCHKSDKGSEVALLTYLVLHQKSCPKPNCECKNIPIKDFLEKAKDETIMINKSVYETLNSVPLKIQNSKRLQILHIFLGELSNYSSSATIQLAISEISFYYFANHYHAISIIEPLNAHEGSFIFSQLITNLRNVIQNGVSDTNTGSFSRSKGIKQSLEYHKIYAKFLDTIDKSCECTVKFWSSLLENAPDVSLLMKFGKELDANRQKFLKLSTQLSQFNSCHSEFLVKYGLYTKQILHNRSGMSTAYHNLQWANTRANQTNAENKFSLFYGNNKIMLIKVRLDQKDFFTITDVNQEAENVLGYSKDNLIKYSLEKMMPGIIARQHANFVQKFFTTMKTDVIGVEKTLFVKNSLNYLVPCNGKKKIVPTLNQGLQGILLLYEDPNISFYTNTRSDKAKAKTGIILCDHKDDIMEFSQTAMRYLEIPEETTFQAKDNNTICNIMPELGTEDIMERAQMPSGVVCAITVKIGNEKSDTCSGLDKSTEIVNDLESISKRVIREKKLLWIKLIVERYGDQTAHIFLISPIMRVAAGEYYPIKSVGTNIYSHQLIVTKEQIKEMKFEEINSRRSGEQACTTVHYSDAMSMASMQSGAASNNGKDSLNKTNEYMQEIQVAASSKKAPSIISKLMGILITFLVILIVLIGVETTQFTRETRDLKERFQIIEYFQIRFCLLIYLAMSPRSYNTYRNAASVYNFVSYTARTLVRADRAVYYNVLTRKSFDKFKIDYDYENIMVTYGSEKYQASFSYAFIKYTNEVLKFSNMNNYTLAKNCVNNKIDPICVDLQMALDYCADNGFYSLRIQQDNAAKLIMNDLVLRAKAGELYLYIIISCCMGILTLSTIIITIVLIKVIKGKSYVMTIFADITDEQIQKIIDRAINIEISNIRYDPKWIADSRGDEKLFWKLVVRTNVKKFIKHKSVTKNVQKTPNEKSLFSSEFINSTIPMEPAFAKPNKIKDNYEGSDEDNESKPKNFEKEKNGKSEKTEIISGMVGTEADTAKIMKKLEEQRIAGKREALGRIDTVLLSSSLCRLGIVVSVFLIYGLASFLFNYYIHDFNTIATNMFYDLAKRNAYGIAFTGLMREAIRLKDKNVLGRSPDPQKGLYVADYMDELQEIELRVQRYKLSGDRAIFHNFFDMLERLDTYEMCKFVDSNPVGQTGSCFTEYKGPQQQGLTAGMAQFITYYRVYIAGVTSADFTNQTTVDAILTNSAMTYGNNYMLNYLQSALELLLAEYRKDTVKFYELVEVIVLSKAIGFGILFVGLFAIVFVRLLEQLKVEIIITHGMLGMIPLSVIEENEAVQKRVLQHRNIV